jgi:hypothetical protein
LAKDSPLGPRTVRMDQPMARDGLLTPPMA